MNASMNNNHKLKPSIVIQKRNPQNKQITTQPNISNKTKKQHFKNNFPSLPSSHIGNKIIFTRLIKLKQKWNNNLRHYRSARERERGDSEEFTHEKAEAKERKDDEKEEKRRWDLN